ncbi:MAG: helicase-related protein, partial [Candidatus Heimdallarchaeota archaeon]|nr:helicase-related protein [Candidatus Heimdallarchaeota archaeon]
PKIVSNRLLKEVDILVGSYNYIFDNTIRKNIFQQLNISYNDIIIIIDEAHNLPNTVLQLYSESISTSTISKAIKELDHVINQYLLLLKNYMRFEKEDKKIDILEVLQIIDTKIGFNLDIELIRDYKRQSENDQKRKKKNFSYSSIVASFLEFLLNSIASPDYSYFLQIMGNNPKLSIIAQDSSLRIRNIIKKVNRVVLASGTMSKIDLLNFGIATSEIRVGKVEAEYPNLHCIVPKGINTSYQNRNAIMYTKIESVIGKILQIKQNTGIFFTSYEMMKKFIPKIQSSKRNTYLIDQNITARDTENMVNSFKKAKDHVLVSVIRGRISEGIDFPAEEMEIIIIIGIPYPHRDIIMTERIDYFEKKFNKQIAENLVYYTDTFSSFIQTTGRAIRSETDRANIFILDDRIMNQKNRLPKYIQDSLISVDDIQLDSIIKKIDNKDW